MWTFFQIKPVNYLKSYTVYCLSSVISNITIWFETKFGSILFLVSVIILNYGIYHERISTTVILHEICHCIPER